MGATRRASRRACAGSDAMFQEIILGFELVDTVSAMCTLKQSEDGQAGKKCKEKGWYTRYGEEIIYK